MYNKGSGTYYAHIQCSRRFRVRTGSVICEVRVWIIPHSFLFKQNVSGYLLERGN